MKLIKDYPNYTISIDGIVKNIKRNKTIKIQSDKDGYHFVQIWNNSKPKKLRIHRLLAIHYLNNPQNKPQVNHINGVKNDNRLENLEWATAKENCIHAWENNLKKPSDKQKALARLLKGRPILNTQNGIYYESIKEAAFYYGKYSANNIAYKLRGRSINNTPFIYA